jgi:hypothetical protein
MLMSGAHEPTSHKPVDASQSAGPLPARVFIDAMVEEEERLLAGDLLAILVGILSRGASTANSLELPSVDPSRRHR